MTKFLRCENGYYVYEFDCPNCGVFGEIGIPVRSTHMFDHGCGQLYIQALPTGKSLYEKPRLIEVNSFVGGGQA
jgi:hypothetical protein